MAALTLALDTYRDKVFGGWQGKSAGITLGAPLRGQLTPGRYNFYSPMPGQPSASMAIDFPLVWLQTLEATGPEVASEDLAVAWLEHLDYSQDELAYASLNLRRGLPPPASGAHANWFRHGACGMMRADFWALIAPGAPQTAAAYAYHDARIDHSEEGVWAAMFLAALGSSAFFLSDPIVLLTIGLAMVPRTCRCARAVKVAIAAWQRSASWLEARESVQHEVGDKNFTDAPQNLGFFTIGLLYGRGDFAGALCAGVNCGYDAETVGGALGAVTGIMLGGSSLPQEWTQPIGDLVIPGMDLRDFEAPETITLLAGRIVSLGQRVTAALSPDVTLVDSPDPGQGRADFLELTPTAPQETASPPATEPIPGAVPGESALDASPPAWSEAFAIPDLSRPLSMSVETAESETPASPVDTPTASDAAPPGAFMPQPVGEALPTASEPPEPAAENQAPPQVPSIVTVSPDLTNAIAWADSSRIRPLLVTPSTAMEVQVGALTVVMDAHDTSTIALNQPKALSFTVYNHAPSAFSGRITLLAPSGWQIIAPPNLGQRQFIAAGSGALRFEYTVRAVEGKARTDIANAILMRFAPDNGSGHTDAEFVLLGAACWWTVGPFANFDGEGFDRSYAPEDRPGLNESYVSRSMQTVTWSKHTFTESALDLEPLFYSSSGVCYGQTVLNSPTGREARLVANTNSGVKLWLNGALVFRRFNREMFRPALGSGSWAADIVLRAGANPVLVKWVRGSEPYAFSLTVSDRFGRGIPEIGNTAW